MRSEVKTAMEHIGKLTPKERLALLEHLLSFPEIRDEVEDIGLVLAAKGDLTVPLEQVLQELKRNGEA